MVGNHSAFHKSKLPFKYVIQKNINRLPSSTNPHLYRDLPFEKFQGPNTLEFHKQRKFSHPLNFLFKKKKSNSKIKT